MPGKRSAGHEGRESRDDLNKYIFKTADQPAAARQEAAAAVPATTPTSLIPGERVCEVLNESSGDAILIDDVVVIHRDCGFLQQCSVRGRKTVYSAAYAAGTGKVHAIQVKVCTYNYWLVLSFVSACVIAFAVIVKSFENMIRGCVAKDNKAPKQHPQTLLTVQSQQPDDGSLRFA